MSFVKKINISTVFLLLISLAILLISKDAAILDTIRWLLCIFVMSFLVRPIFRFDNVSFPDAGFGVSFGLELALSFLLCFIILLP